MPYAGAVESHEILRDAFEKTSPKEIASELGISLSLVYKWSQPPEEDGQGSGSRNPLDRTTELVRVTRDIRIIQWLCHQAGGFFVRNPKNNPEERQREVGPATNAILQQFAELLESITTAASDHRITDDESARIRRRWDDLKTFTEGFVRACEQGNFDQMPIARR
ncbi:MAG: phage regulatory CII family protein [Verrucomicrobiota bacterium]